MPSVVVIIDSAIILMSLAAMIVIFRRDLMMLQLNSYRNERYVRWANQSNESTTYPRIGNAIALFVIFVYNMPFTVTGAVAALIMLWVAINLGVRKYKKPLVMTRRAWRILVTMFVLAAAITTLAVCLVPDALFGACAALIAIDLLSPFVLLSANWILKPVEKHINNRYRNEAVAILRSMPGLKIIGITGSYGKTSTKHYLHRILSEKFDVLMTPGSFNTPMGVIRTVREHMRPYNEVFIVEMGAKQIGDIKEICDIVNPQYGILTAVGEQHLESFKSIENVQRTKFELVDALPADGIAAVNNDYEKIADRKIDNCRCLRYVVEGDAERQAEKAADFVARDIEFDATGTSFTVEGPGCKLRLHTRLVGECNVSNLTAAVVMALQLGVDEKKIAYAVANIEQVEHRLNIKKTPAGITIIDDAFNSNPQGSRMALDVLGGIRTGKRIVVTPGMIELGDRTFELNRQLGEHAAVNADIVVVVGQYNREAIAQGLSDAGFPNEQVRLVDSFAEAQSVLASILTSGDIVLYENDLPDTFK